MYLNRQAMRVVEKNERGLVKYRKRYRFGDEVDTDHIDEVQVENLVNSGVLVESRDDLTGRGGASAPYRGSEVTGAATGEAGDNPEHDTDATDAATGDGVYDVPEDEAPDADVVSPQDEDEVEMVDRYSDMDYADLQKTAKDAGLNAGGSADDIRARLRANDAS